MDAHFRTWVTRCVEAHDVNALIDEFQRTHDAIDLWQDRYRSLLRDAQASEAAYDKALNEGP